MSGTSRQAGYIAPLDVGTTDADEALTDTLQAMVAGITGIPGTLVRPRWQPVPPAQPLQDVSWCAIGVLDETPVTSVFLTSPDARATGPVTMRHQTALRVLASFYGPFAGTNAARLRDGLMIAQNRDDLTSSDLGLTEIGPILTAPELVGLVWLNRKDVPLRFSRIVTRAYSIAALEQGLVALKS